MNRARRFRLCAERVQFPTQINGECAKNASLANEYQLRRGFPIPAWNRVRKTFNADMAKPLCEQACRSVLIKVKIP
jgi:hypothetical protein